MVMTYVLTQMDEPLFYHVDVSPLYLSIQHLMKYLQKIYLKKKLSTFMYTDISASLFWIFCEESMS